MLSEEQKRIITTEHYIEQLEEEIIVLKNKIDELQRKLAPYLIAENKSFNTSIHYDSDF